MKKAMGIEQVEKADDNEMVNMLLQRYPLLLSKSEEEMASLNKSVLRKLDWRFLVRCSADSQVAEKLTNVVYSLRSR